ncbi:MAG: DUF2817 domain-containing protein [Burkholderiaceae bacterium]|nr:DUF2817 domain-containing protein [Burkholderiaceae bacterium]
MPSFQTATDTTDDLFYATYSTARQAWREAVQARGGAIDSQQHPLTGPEGEPLWMDLARFGDPLAGRALVIACGTHGIEGYAGSAVQTAWLRLGGPGALPAGCAVLLIHAVNPWGFAYRQRVTENNVDLNRNFTGFPRPAGSANSGYAELHPQLQLRDWSEAEIARAFAAMDAFRLRVGEKAFSDAFNGGQHLHCDGIFYGGSAPEWSNQALRRLLRRHLCDARQGLFVDLHTGIGPYGQPFLINFDAPGSPARERALRIWGEEALSGKGSTHAAFASFQGVLIDALAEELPGCELSSVVVEFGTHERRRMQRAHLALMWLRRQRGNGEAVQRARAEYLEAFIPADPAWRRSVLDGGVALCARACAALLDEAGA